jgi:hypothetical protein
VSGLLGELPSLPEGPRRWLSSAKRNPSAITTAWNLQCLWSIALFKTLAYFVSMSRQFIFSMLREMDCCHHITQSAGSTRTGDETFHAHLRGRHSRDVLGAGGDPFRIPAVEFICGSAKVSTVS